MIDKEYIMFIHSNIDSLMMEEETALYFKNSLCIITSDIYDIAYEFVYSILVLLEHNTKEKAKLYPIRIALEQKVKSLNSSGELTFDL